jgi:SAM-dependent methyltransferase
LVRHTKAFEQEYQAMSVSRDPREQFDAALIPGMRARLAELYAHFRALETDAMQALAPPEVGGTTGAYRQRDCPNCATRSVGQTPILRAHGLDLLDCPSCGLTYTRQVMDADADAARYARPEQDRAAMRLRTSDPYLELETARDRYYLARLMDRGFLPGRLLEVGCGTGTLLLEAQRLGWHTLGVEPSHAAVQVARERGAAVVQGWFPADLPADAHAFDAVAVLDVLEHFADPLDFLREMRACLSPCGRLLVQVPNWDSLLVQLEGASSSVVCPGHWTYFTPRTLSALLSRSGFRPLSIETVVSELDKIMTHAPERIADLLGRLRPMAPVGALSAARLHELGLGYKLFGVFALS